MSKTTEVGEIIIKLIDRFPNAFSRTLARVAHENNPGVFSSAESARSMVRYYRQAHGERNRSRNPGNKKPRLFNVKLFNPYGLPESEADDYPPYNLPRGANKVLILPDMHVPYHDVQAVTVAIREGERQKINAILLNGDYFDFYKGSRFVKDPRKRDVAYELDAGAEMIRRLHDIFGCPIFFKKGNHDERWETYMMVHAPEIIGIPEFELNNLLNSRLDFNLETIHRQVVYAGKLPIVHAHEYGGYSGGTAASPARWLFMKSKKSAMMSHTHRESSYTTKNIEGGMITTWSTGCLCGLWPEYAQLNEWVNGFAIVSVQSDGNFLVSNYRIDRGELFT